MTRPQRPPWRRQVALGNPIRYSHPTPSAFSSRTSCYLRHFSPVVVSGFRSGCYGSRLAGIHRCTRRITRSIFTIPGRHQSRMALAMAPPMARLAPSDMVRCAGCRIRFVGQCAMRQSKDGTDQCHLGGSNLCARTTIYSANLSRKDRPRYDLRNTPTPMVANGKDRS
jgi:hypothetical protein